MYLAINGLVFILLSLYALRVLFSKASYVKFSKNRYVLLSAPEKFLLLTMLTGMIALTTGGFGSIRLLWWIALIILAFIVYRKSININTFVLICFVFLSYILITLTWAPSLEFGIRVFLKYLYPILIMIFAMSFVTSKEFIYIALKYMVIAAFLMSILLGGVMTDIVGIWIFYLGGVFWPIAVLADFFSVMSAISFVLWWKTGEKIYLLLIVWFLLSCMIQSVRTGLLSIGFMVIFGMYFRYRLLSLPYIIGIILLGLSAILFVPNVKEKMFFDTTKVQTFADITGAIEEGNINTNARSVMWEYLLKNFYEKDKLLGQGIGTVQNYMYNNYVFGGLEAPHNDFVQMLCDIGKLGVILYLLMPISFLILNWKYFKDVRYSELHLIGTIAILSFLSIIPAMNFDNIINYSFPVHSMPFIFIGLFYAYKRILIQEERDQNV